MNVFVYPTRQLGVASPRPASARRYTVATAMLHCAAPGHAGTAPSPVAPDHQGQLVERDHHPPVRWLLHCQLVVSTRKPAEADRGTAAARGGGFSCRQSRGSTRHSECDSAGSSSEPRDSAPCRGAVQTGQADARPGAQAGELAGPPQAKVVVARERARDHHRERDARGDQRQRHAPAAT